MSSIFGKGSYQGKGEPNKIKALYNNEEGTTALRSYIQSNLLSNSPEEHIRRIEKYQLYWNFYKGEHWRQFNDTFLSFNYAAATINKVISFLLGPKGFSFTVTHDEGEVLDEEFEKAIEAVIHNIWKENGGVMTQKKILQMGSVCGDVWIFLQANTKPEYLGGDKYVEIRCLDSRHVIPEFANGDQTRMSGLIIRQPLVKNDNNYRVFVTKITDTSIETWFQKDTNFKYEEATKYELSKNKNPYGFIPAVHIQNRINSSDFYGFSDLRDILTLNKIYNETAQILKEVVDYYTAPVTVVTGGTIRSMSRGVGNVWSGLPSDANVFNLSLGEDMTSTMSFMALIKTAIHELSDVPETTMGKTQAISNTSAAALQVTYQPLIQQADAKSVTYSSKIEILHKMALIIEEKINPQGIIKKVLSHMDLKAVLRSISIKPEWVYGLPQDRVIDLAQAETELRLGLNSKHGIMQRLGFKNISKVMEEIRDEKFNDAADNRAIQVADDMASSGAYMRGGGGEEEGAEEKKRVDNPLI